MKFIPAYIIILSLLTLFIFGCSSVPECVPVEVKVPVSVSCVEVMPTKPDTMMDKLSDDASDFEKVKALVIDYIANRKYINELEATLEGCRG